MMAKIYLGFGNQRKALALLHQSFENNANSEIRINLLNDITNILYKPFAVVVVAAALFAARKFNVQLSEVAVLVLSLFQAAMAFNRMVAYQNGFMNVLPSYEQIEKLRRRAVELKQPSGSLIFKNLNEAIELKNVSFAYSGNDLVLNDLSLQIKKGKMAAIVGRSGAGKTTLIDMIMGFHIPDKGEILIDNAPIFDYDITSFRHKIGFVPQESLLFNTSIRDNLIWAKENATEQEIHEACRLAHADEFLNSFPQKYDTVVGDRGVRLSGGQIQRIALARALLRQPEILILDEATSALDSHSEKLIQDAIDNFVHQTTIVVIAHRLSTVKKADIIFVLEKGKLVESGHYGELMLKKGSFYSMVQAQELNVK